MKTRNLIIHVSKLFILILFFSSCTEQLITKRELSNDSCCYWDVYPFSKIFFENETIIYTISYNFCINDTVSKFAYYIGDSLRNNCCPPHNREWKIERNTLIINSDTIFIERYLKDTLFVRQMIFDTIRHYKLVRNKQYIKVEYLHFPEPYEI
jgi:hypothetical protein